MKDDKRSVRSGFIATLALVISIIALIVSLMAFNKTVTQAEMYDEIRTLHEGLLTGTKQASEKLEKMLKKTGDALEKISDKIEQKGKTEGETNQ